MSIYSNLGIAKQPRSQQKQRKTRKALPLFIFLGAGLIALGILTFGQRQAEPPAAAKPSLSPPVAIAAQTQCLDCPPQDTDTAPATPPSEGASSQNTARPLPGSALSLIPANKTAPETETETETEAETETETETDNEPYLAPLPIVMNDEPPKQPPYEQFSNSPQQGAEKETEMQPAPTQERPAPLPAAPLPVPTPVPVPRPQPAPAPPFQPAPNDPPPAGPATQTAIPLPAAPPPAPTPKPVPALYIPSTDDHGDYFVQLLATPHEDSLCDIWDTLKAELPHFFKATERSITQVKTHDGQVLFRLRVGAFIDRRDASEFCRLLQDEGHSCFVTQRQSAAYGHAP